MIRVLMLVFLSLGSCNYEVKNHEEKGEDVKKQIIKYLNEINYSTNVELNNNVITIKGKPNFDDSKNANILLLNYLKYKYFKNSSKSDSNIEIVVKYESGIISTNFKELKNNQSDFFWSIIEYSLKNFTINDCVYYDLTSKEVIKAGKYNCEGDLWKLINEIALENENYKNCFLHFYTWSEYPYSENVKFSKSKLEPIIEKLGLNPKLINDEYIDSLYKLN